MKQLRIKELVIKSFKGQTRKVTFDECNCMISGKNGAGKSTMMKAWIWLLSGYTDSFNPKNHELYDNTKELDENTPIASVKASIKLGEYDYTIERNAKASFSRKRGEETYTKDASDKYTFKIDDIEVSVKNFTEWIESNICPKDLIQYMVDGSFIATLSIEDKDKCRKVLENIIGEIKQEDFKNDYSMLFKMLERFNIENLKEQTKQRMKQPKKRLEELPTLIESKQQDIANIESIDFTENENKVAELNDKIKAIDDELKGSSERIKPLIEKRNQELANISELKRQLNDREIEYNKEQSIKPNELKERIANIEKENVKIKKENDTLLSDREDIKKQYDLAQIDLDICNEMRNSLLKERDEVKSRIFNVDVCAYCGQELPIEKVDELRTKFNDKKKADLDKIITQGKATKLKIENTQRRIDKYNEMLSKDINLTPLIDANELNVELANTLSQISDFKETNEYSIALDKINQLSQNVTLIPEIDNDAMTLKKSEYMAELAKLNKELGQKDILDKYKQDLQALIDEQKANGVELAKLQRLESQINAYIEEKANIISCRVNDLLDFAKIDMQEQLKDGSWKPSATICRKDGVKYATLNNSDRILTTIDLQMMFNKYFDVSLPIFVDEASTIALSRIPQAKEWQKIYLKYEECDFKVDRL